jgi:hypothetical protein
MNAIRILLASIPLMSCNHRTVKYSVPALGTDGPDMSISLPKSATNILVSEKELSRCKEKGNGVCAKGLRDGCVTLLIVNDRVVLSVDRGTSCAEFPWMININGDPYILDVP